VQIIEQEDGKRRREKDKVALGRSQKKQTRCIQGKEVKNGEKNRIALTDRRKKKFCRKVPEDGGKA